MSTREPKIFDRVYSNKELFRGRALRAQLWSLAAAVALTIILLIGGHLAGVVYHTFVRRDGLLKRMT